MQEELRRALAKMEMHEEKKRSETLNKVPDRERENWEGSSSVAAVSDAMRYETLYKIPGLELSPPGPIQLL